MSSIKGFNLRKAFIPLFLLFILTGCATVGPDYKTPEIEVSKNWNTPNDPALLPQKEIARDWWLLFNDPVLNRLIKKAEKNNLDLLTAIARVEETRARLGVAMGDKLPSGDFNAGVSRIQTSKNSGNTGYIDTYYSSGIGASWEIDLFGRIRRSVEAAKAELDASMESRTDVLISLYSNVSLNYLEIRTNQERLRAAKSNIDSQKELLKLTKSRLENGLATELDLRQAERLLASAQADVPPLRISISKGINNLSVLLGEKPGYLYDELIKPGDIPLPPLKATIGVPADLLRQRPDIRRAERLLAAQTARIGVAKAALYPSFSLTGTFGFESVNADDLFNADSNVFSFGPSLRWNIFSGGRIRNLVKAQDAVTKRYLFSYEQSILNALREVENALKAYIEDRVRLDALKRSVTAARQSVELATNLYKQGLVDFQPVLDAKRDQFNFENQLAAARGNSAANFVRLYAALGGGWNPDEVNNLKGSIKESKNSLENKGEKNE
jgi:NodT family efflux transporter outer membrane factor (OMF) lipoprotein